MKLDNVLLLSLLVSGTNALNDNRDRRAIVYATVVTTVNLPYTDYINGIAGTTPIANNVAAAPTSAAPAPVSPTPTPVAPVAPAAPVTPQSDNSGLKGILSGLFGGIFGSDSNPGDNTAASPAPVTTSNGSSRFQGLLSNFLDGFFGDNSSSDTTQNTGTTSNPTTIVSVSTDEFTSAGTQDLNSNPTSSSSSFSLPSSQSSTNSGFSAQGPDASTIDQVVNYAQMGGGIAFSPYTKSGQCKSASQVALDMSVLSNYGIIRLYGVDCNGVDNVLASLGSSQKLFVGIYNIDSSSISNDLGTLKTAVENSSRGWGAIHTVSIGNEMVNSGKASASDIGNAMLTARNWFKANVPNYSGALVSVDTLVAVVNNPELCHYSDYLAVNCHPFWDGGVDPSDSGPWLQKQISNLNSVCGGNKNILITESGWPTQGSSFGNCVPSLQNQLSAVRSIGQTLGDQVLMFTTYNDYWKDPGSYNVEQHWGIYGDPSA